MEVSLFINLLKILFRAFVEALIILAIGVLILQVALYLDFRPLILGAYTLGVIGSPVWFVGRIIFGIHREVNRFTREG